MSDAPEVATEPRASTPSRAKVARAAATPQEALEALLERADYLYHDIDFETARAWKEGEPGRRVVGYLPVWVPVELITAAGMLPLGIVGGGDQVEIIRGDAFFQSYICHLPRSVIELGVSGRLDFCDGFLFPSTCDVIRNLSGIWKLHFPDTWVKYFDVPQNFDPGIGGRWLRGELESIRSGLEELRGEALSDDEIRTAIRLHDDNRAFLRRLYDLRCREPWRVSTSEAYLIQRAGLVLPVGEHNDLVRMYLEAVQAADRPLRDNARVVLSGAFCEQPPLGLITTLERAGCDIVDDDLLMGPRFFSGPVDGATHDAGAGREDDGGSDGPAGASEGPAGLRDDPLDVLVNAFLERRSAASFIYVDDDEKGAALAEMVQDRRAEGVIFCAPSFCDPALLDRPMLVRALERRDISYITMKYSENTGQFQTIREQAGTFGDSLKLWSST